LKLSLTLFGAKLEIILIQNIPHYLYFHLTLGDEEHRGGFFSLSDDDVGWHVDHVHEVDDDEAYLDVGQVTEDLDPSNHFSVSVHEDDLFELWSNEVKELLPINLNV
jgi:hypothetical protein